MKRTDNGYDWQSAWLSELDEKTPPLAEYVKNEPLPKVEKGGRWQRIWDKAVSLMHNRRIMAGAGALAMLLVAVIAVVLLRPAPVADYSETVIALEINPAVLMSTDKDGNVTSLVALNADADAVLSLSEIESEVLGRPLDKAVTAYTDLCARLGFIDYSGDAVRLSSAGADVSGIERELTDYFKEHGIFAVVNSKSRSEAEFAGLYGISKEGDLYGAVSEMQSFYTDRYSEGKELSALQEKYKADVLEGIKKYIKEEAEASIAEVDDDGVVGWIMAIIHAFLDEETGEELLATIQKLEELTGEEVDVISSTMENLAHIPESREEYLEKSREYRNYRAEELKRENEQAYSEARDRIKNSSYRSYIRRIEKKYGSLDAYFEEHDR